MMIENTYMFYTADNGYHLGEHRLLTGKCEPFESDVHLVSTAKTARMTRFCIVFHCLKPFLGLFWGN